MYGCPWIAQRCTETPPLDYGKESGDHSPRDELARGYLSLSEIRRSGPTASRGRRDDDSYLGPHSVRSACMGSTDAARRAGTTPERNTVINNRTAAAQ